MRESGAYVSRSTLTATSRPNAVSVARYTAPIPPRAISAPEHVPPGGGRRGKRGGRRIMDGRGVRVGDGRRRVLRR